MKRIIRDWRLLTAYVLIIMGVVAGFIVQKQLSDEVERQAQERRIELCDAVNEQRRVLIELVESSPEIIIPPDASPALIDVLIDAQENQERARQLAHSLLVVRDCEEVVPS